MKINFKTISMAASTAVLGAVLLTGCGSSSSSSGTTDITGVDGYLGGKGRVIYKANNGHADVNASEFLKGKLKLPGSITANKITIKGNSGFWLDVKNDGIFKAEDNESMLGADLIGPNDGLVVSHITTGPMKVKAKYEGNTSADANASIALADFLLEKTKNLDTVAAVADAVTDQAIANILTIGEQMKVALLTGDDTTLMAISESIDESEIEDNATSGVDLDELLKTASDNGGNDDILAAARAKAEVMQDTIQFIVDNNLSDVEGLDLGEFVARISDGGSTATAALTAIQEDNDDINVSTAIDNATDLDSNITAANNVMPAVLTLTDNTLTIGSTTVDLLGDSFEATISNELNISTIGQISFGAIALSKEANATASTSVDFCTVISDDTNKTLTMKIVGANIITTENSKDVSIQIPATATLSLSQTNINGLIDIIEPNSELNTTLNSTLTQSDFSFDVTTLLDTMTFADKDALVEKVDEFLKLNQEYTVKLSMNTELPNVIADTITGTVTVGSPTAACTTTPSVTVAKPTLTANSTTITVDETVTFTFGTTTTSAEVELFISDASGIFGAPLDTATSPYTHTFNEAGTYYIKAEAEIEGQSGVYSDLVTVVVSAAQSDGVTYDTTLDTADTVVSGLKIKTNDSNDFTVEFDAVTANDTTTGSYDGSYAYNQVSVFLSDNTLVGTTNMVGEYAGKEIKFISAGKSKTITVGTFDADTVVDGDSIIYVKLP